MDVSNAIDGTTSFPKILEEALAAYAVSQGAFMLKEVSEKISSIEDKTDLSGRAYRLYKISNTNEKED